MNQGSQTPNLPTDLSDADYQRLRQDLSKELRRLGRQHFMAIGVHALAMSVLAVVLFLSSQKYHDLMLWAVGLCLLLFSAIELLDLDYRQSGKSWLDVFSKPNEN